LRMPYIKDLISNIRTAMSSTSGYYDPSLRMSLLDTDYIKEKIRRVLPAEYLDQPVHKVVESKLLKNVSKMKNITVRQLLEKDLNNFSYESKLSIKDALEVRRKLLHIQIKSNENTPVPGNSSDVESMSFDSKTKNRAEHKFP
jgi:hypothetical protein